MKGFWPSERVLAVRGELLVREAFHDLGNTNVQGFGCFFLKRFFWMESGTVLKKCFDPHVKGGRAWRGPVLKERLAYILAALIIATCAVCKLVCKNPT